MATSKSTRALWSCKNAGTRGSESNTHNIHVWYIYLHLPKNINQMKANITFVPWILWGYVPKMPLPEFSSPLKKTQALDFLAYC